MLPLAFPGCEAWWWYFNNLCYVWYCFNCVSNGKPVLWNEHSFSPEVIWINDAQWAVYTGVSFHNLNFPKEGSTTIKATWQLSIMFYSCISTALLGFGSRSFISEHLQHILRVISRCCASPEIIPFLPRIQTQYVLRKEKWYNLPLNIPDFTAINFYKLGKYSPSMSECVCTSIVFQIQLPKIFISCFVLSDVTVSCYGKWKHRTTLIKDRKVTLSGIFNYLSHGNTLRSKSPIRTVVFLHTVKSLSDLKCDIVSGLSLKWS